MPRVLNENDIHDILLEDIPSDGKSTCSLEPEEEYNDGPQMMVLGDIPPELQPPFDDDASDDDVPLSNFASTSDNHVPTTSSASSSGTPVVEPKWKKNYRMEEPMLIKRHKPSVPAKLRTESSMHQPERTTSRRCAKCSTKKRPARTVWQCSTCKVPLCIRDNKTCFRDFHN